MYGNVYEDEERFERQAVFPRMLCERAKDFSLVSSAKYVYPWLYNKFSPIMLH